MTCEEVNGKLLAEIIGECSDEFEGISDFLLDN